MVTAGVTAEGKELQCGSSQAKAAGAAQGIGELVIALGVLPEGADYTGDLRICVTVCPVPSPGYSHRVRF